MATSEQLEFWGTIIEAGKSVRVDIDEDDEEHVSLSLVALGSSTSEEETKKNHHAILSVVEDVGVNGAKEIFLATLRRGKTEQFSLDVVLSDTFIMKNSGNVDAHVTGWRMDGRVRGNNLEKEMEEYEDEEMEDELFEDMAAERAMMDTSSSDSEEEDADFASEDEETD
jgi:hypothetical protein